MEDSRRLYRELIERIDEELPGVAGQIRDEISRGHQVYVSSIDEEEQQNREILLHDEKLPGIGKTDITFTSYDDDDRLIVLLEALQTLAATMLESRRVLAHFTGSHNLTSSIVFASPDEQETQDSLASAGIVFDDEGLDLARTKLTAAIRSVRESS